MVKKYIVLIRLRRYMRVVVRGAHEVLKYSLTDSALIFGHNVTCGFPCLPLRWLVMTAARELWRKTATTAAESCRAARWRCWRRRGNPFSARRARAPSAATPWPASRHLLPSRATTWSSTLPWRVNTSVPSASWL